jgi:hypothetical protein
LVMGSDAIRACIETGFIGCKCGRETVRAAV